MKSLCRTLALVAIAVFACQTAWAQTQIQAQPKTPAQGILATQATAPVFTLGVIPQQVSATVIQQWAPLMEELSQRTGYRLELKTAADIPAFERSVAAGEYDFIYINPYLYTVYRRAPGYAAFARQEEGLRGLIVVHRDSPIQTLADLRTRSVAFTPAAFAATVLPLAELRKQRISVLRNYVGAHDVVYRAVADGTHAAGGGIPQTLEQAPPAIRARLRVIWLSESHTSHAFAAHPRVPGQAVDRLRQALVGLAKDAPGRSLLKGMGLSAIMAAPDSDWDEVRDLGIDKLDAQWRSPQAR